MHPIWYKAPPYYCILIVWAQSVGTWVLYTVYSILYTPNRNGVGTKCTYASIYNSNLSSAVQDTVVWVWYQWDKMHTNYCRQSTPFLKNECQPNPNFLCNVHKKTNSGNAIRKNLECVEECVPHAEDWMLLCPIPEISSLRKMYDRPTGSSAAAANG